MDIKHLRFFIAIVENNFNLSRTAQQLYISQPTLSIMINDFEEKQGIKLFNKKYNKILGLTMTGKQFYEDSLEVIRKYDKMHQNLFSTNQKLDGNITIGIPPLILSIVFSKIMPEIILENPNIHFNIKEYGANRLRQELILENVDIAILLHPERIAANTIDSFQIQESELCVFVSKNHHLANKKILTWIELHNEKLAIFDKTFMIHHLIKEKCKYSDINPQIILESASWDFLINSTRISPQLMTIIPKPTVDSYGFQDIVAIPMENPIPWKVMVSRLKKDHYSTIEEYIFNKMLEKFHVIE
ncbi:TPA: LysR family transcriptional regulator [Streptococcus equi subsp. zooepidemicus]|uniref:LysR family transcriptional regulator n=1 Tax=Streptococcus equi TaxID=1336 RepID=UPI0019819853|nr:LysR family transcriptional regulator [Streptococcus equi]MCD3408089.1 LysR family transcriptional regulator [Streptococcus equi subsp. zooepidemicus]MDI5900738.1 LysR family transcriptional regulator [Streptococcus equi subsp. zooepidemicus]MDI5946744.1 LysR family transcriptional regulator [Streptococcus equi subsp. zooepidemicus]MDI5958422.1 LysR family transcriptional regulator [Streptococcus equi subsp. zooepidemicus]MDI5960000.1 LysR family transcriptional regulator [Streptococcus equ